MNKQSQKIQDLRQKDIRYFHKGGAHGNCEVDNPQFNPDLFRDDCSLCQERLDKFNKKMGWE